MLQLILASASPRRRQLLAELGLSFTVMPVEVDERPLPGEEPEASVRRVAAAKAEAAAAQAPAGLILAADTIVVLDGAILGKPASISQAREYLDRLRGRAHRVATAVVLLETGSGRRAEGVEWTTVWLRNFSDDERDAYIATADPFDKAGGYAIQHPAFRPVERIEGSRSNVVGLPLELLRRLLAQFDIELAGVT